MNVLNAQKRNDLEALLRARMSFREIERRLGVRRETVSRYAKRLGLHPNQLKANGEASGFKSGQNEAKWLPSGGASSGGKDNKIPKHARSACEPYREWIEAQVRLKRNAMAIYQDLVERHGFSHKYNSVKRFVRSLKAKEPEVYDRLEYEPAEEAQVDFGQGAPTVHPQTGKRRRPWLFVMTLKYSRRSYRAVVWRADEKSWCKLHEQAFRYFGGVPRYIVLDNLKQGVIRPDIYEPELNPLYSAVLLHYGAVADPARVRDPNRKGTVESAIKHTQDTGLKGREFKCIEEQNEWLLHWEERWASKRIHGRAKRQVQEMFAEEKPFLKPLPTHGFRYFEQETRKVQDDGCIQVKNAFYAAHPAPLYSSVIVRIYDLEIQIIDPKTLTLIRRHTRSSRPGFVSMNESDRIFNPSRETKFLLSQAKKIGPNTHALCESWFKKQGRVGQRRMRGVLNLAKTFESSHIEEATKIALKNNITSSKSVRTLVARIKRTSTPSRSFEVEFTQSHELIREGEEYGRFFDEFAATNKAPKGEIIH